MKFMPRTDDGLGAIRGIMWILIFVAGFAGVIGIIVWLLVTVARMTWGG